MAARVNPATAERIRQQIKGIQLVNLLQKHIDGKHEMSATQVQAAQFLLSYIMPKPMQTVQQTGELTIRWKS